MATKKYKAITPGFRQRRTLDYEELTTNKPEKSLTKLYTKNKAGRNNTGKLSVRRRGGGNKRLFRDLDFRRIEDGIKGIVKTVEYDPNRTAFISLVYYSNGKKSYIITPQKTKVGDEIESGKDADIRTGNTLQLKDIPVGSIIHNVELSKNKGAQLARSAGTQITLMGKHEKYATLKLPSGETRLVDIECRATLGQVSNVEKRNTVVGKAGASRWKRKRPKVRGAVMNPCDHPHGGGEGRAPVGAPSPRTKWGKPAIGYKTRSRKKQSNKYIVKRRK